MSILSKLQALLTAANTTTGESDTTLTDAMQTLVDGYGQGGGDYIDLIDGTASGSFEDSSITFLRNYAIAYLNSLTSIKLTGLTENTSSIPGNLADNSYALSYNSNLETLVITSVVRGGTSCIRNNPKLTAVDVPFSFIGGSLFQNDTLLSTLIIRNSNVCALANTGAFTSTPFASGGSGGTLYVPNDLIASYQSASNWSTILGYENNQILPIEGSQYENYYADGTAIS